MLIFFPVLEFPRKGKVGLRRPPPFSTHWLLLDKTLVCSACFVSSWQQVLRFQWLQAPRNSPVHLHWRPEKTLGINQEKNTQAECRLLPQCLAVTAPCPWPDLPPYTQLRSQGHLNLTAPQSQASGPARESDKCFKDLPLHGRSHRWLENPASSVPCLSGDRIHVISQLPQCNF